MDRRRHHQHTKWSRLYLIADAAFAEESGVELREVVREFVRAGGRMVSLRPSSGHDRYLGKVGRALAGLLVAVRGTFFVHRRADLAMLVGADGVHLPSHGLSRSEIGDLMGRSTICGRSCHSLDDVEQWGRAGGDFATFSPLFSSISKPGYGPGLTLDDFQSGCEAVEFPVYALGGVVPGRVGTCLEAGAYGVATVGGIMGAESPFDATRRYLEAIEQTLPATA